MFGLPLGFLQPLVLTGLVALPVLWWLLRLIPPRPRQIAFPPTALLARIAPKEETPARTPWWLTLLRLLLAALVILAAAGPLWNPPVAGPSRNGPLAMLIDDGWTAAGSWEARLRTGDDILARAEADGRGVTLIPLSEPGRDFSLQTADAARVRLKQLKPKPHTIERGAVLPALSRFIDASPGAELVWLSDGVDAGGGDEFARNLANALKGRTITVVTGGMPQPHALVAADNAAGALSVKVLRATAMVGETGTVRALDLKGLPLGEVSFAFPADATETNAEFTLPVEIRNDIARLEIVGERSAGAVQLLDKRWRRRTIGILSGASSDNAQPLLAGTYYLTRALNPFADVRVAQSKAPADAVAEFIDQKLPMIVLADIGNAGDAAHEKLTEWVERGGVLVRFAGPRLAASEDDLVPVRLRRGGRSLGGSLSWEQPQPLGAFTREGPFFGMPVPSDVTVSRQVLAEPDSTLSDRTWATLADGTPLVTAQKRGKGLLVLFHVTADTRWSNLPLSGSLVEMLKRTVALAGASGPAADRQTGADSSAGVVAPTRLLDGFGAFGPPPATARPLPAAFADRADADHPPGFYGPPEGLIAVNTLTPADRLKPLDIAPLGARLETYRVGEPLDLRGPVLIAALTLLVIDALVIFVLSGGLGLLRRRRAAAAAVITLLAIVPAAPEARAQNPYPNWPLDRIMPREVAPLRMPAPAPAPNATPDVFAMKATEQTRLAFIVTGNAEVDSISKSGLDGLTLFLAQHTALEAGEAVGVDPARDELGFFPLIYWPVAPGAPTPSAEALQRIDAYMKQGGTILFDTRDAIEAPPGSEMQSPGMVQLRRILASLDVPELEPVPRDHVLTKTFYLLRNFPGRFSNGQLWVEALPAQKDDEERPARAGDGVSSILITSNDLAGAWATQPDGRPMLPMAAGGLRQREIALRAGVNIVMYILTGNYKADQVHVPALLERLGQ